MSPDGFSHDYNVRINNIFLRILSLTLEFYLT